MSESGLDLYWIPVAAGTSRAQQASLRLWEAIEAFRTHRRRATLLHSALKLRLPGEQKYTLEVTPAFLGESVPPLMTGPVGARFAGRLRLFRYQLRCLSVDTLPDEQWAVGGPLRLSGDAELVRRVLELASAAPPHVWGRRAPGTHEMWTSDSTISWLLVRAGLDVSALALPPGGRAPGWFAGIQLAALDPGR